MHDENAKSISIIIVVIQFSSTRQKANNNNDKHKTNSAMIRFVLLIQFRLQTKNEIRSIQPAFTIPFSFHILDPPHNFTKREKLKQNKKLSLKEVSNGQKQTKHFN